MPPLSDIIKGFDEAMRAIGHVAIFAAGMIFCAFLHALGDDRIVQALWCAMLSIFALWVSALCLASKEE